MIQSRMTLENLNNFLVKHHKEFQFANRLCELLSLHYLEGEVRQVVRVSEPCGDVQSKPLAVLNHTVPQPDVVHTLLLESQPQ